MINITSFMNSQPTIVFRRVSPLMILVVAITYFVGPIFSGCEEKREKGRVSWGVERQGGKRKSYYLSC